MSSLDNNQSNFPSDQALILRDIARNGATDEAAMYAYGDLGPNGQSNGLSNSFQDDLDDPAALLGSLSNYEHPNSGNEGSAATSTDHFASLLQAATTATEAEAAQTGHGQGGRLADQSIASNQFGIAPAPVLTRSKRKRSNQEDDYPSFISSKHRKTSIGSEEDQLAREREIWGPEEIDEEEHSMISEYQQTPTVTANARAVGVHSAAALFRRPSMASKKYTRPPMSKLFTSLELTPEQFLHLQAAAKNYMLDERHPERSDCVGNKGRGDTDMTKLKLFGCVKSFLEDEGWGDRCFGENAPGADQRKLKWPQMKNKLVSLVTPLLRRMVTNERQRRYAMESRKSRSQGKPKEGNNDQLDQSSEPPKDDTWQPPQPKERSRPRKVVSPAPFPEIDPKLNQYRYEENPPYPSEEAPSPARSHTPNGFATNFPIKPPDTSGIKYLINIVKGGHRIKPGFTLNPTTCPGFPSLVQHIQSVMDDGRGTRSIQVLGVNGLMDVSDQATWEATVESIKQIEWMDGEIKCVVHMEEDD